MVERNRMLTREREPLTRRDVIRRGAVIGGTLLWAAPAVQTLAPKALAHTVGSAVHCCCQCMKDNKSKGCTGNVAPSYANCRSQTNKDDKDAFCKSGETASFHCGPNTFSCATTKDAEFCQSTDHSPSPT
jgi:hypothetical protein